MEVHYESLTVVETDVHYPTDVNLLWDALRCLLRVLGVACAELGEAHRGRQDRQLRLRLGPHAGQQIRAAERGREGAHSRLQAVEAIGVQAAHQCQEALHGAHARARGCLARVGPVRDQLAAARGAERARRGRCVPPRFPGNAFLVGEVCFVADLHFAGHGPASVGRAGHLPSRGWDGPVEAPSH